jgi:hypothetical protein
MGAIQAIKDAPYGYVVEIKEPTRKLSQNAKFHAILTDISSAGSVHWEEAIS